ncbi:hypothetical protein FBQ82_04465 [Anaerolineae bacterium CFX7]|nr:hypothetical protein [Anaerolineae bacterium CFX7]
MNLIVEIKSEDGKPISVLVAAPKNFKTGSRGYHGQGKIEIDGKRYQTQVQLVEIGSKNSPPNDQAPEENADENA